MLQKQLAWNQSTFLRSAAVRNTNRSVRSTVDAKLKEELKSRVADQHWKSSPTPTPLRGADTRLSFRARSPRGRLHPVSTTTSWLVGWWSPRISFLVWGRTDFHRNAPFLGKQKPCLEGKKTLWMEQWKNLRYKYLQSRFILQVPRWLYLDLMQQRYWRKHKWILLYGLLILIQPLS